MFTDELLLALEFPVNCLSLNSPRTSSSDSDLTDILYANIETKDDLWFVVIKLWFDLVHTCSFLIFFYQIQFIERNSIFKGRGSR